FSAEWESRSLRAPPNYRARLTWWPSRVLGLGVDYSYDKLFGSAATLADNGLTQLEFSEGLNLLTLNAYRRWPLSGSEITPYIGAGIGVSVPFVEFDSGAGRTAEYQIGGPAVRWLAGAIYPVNDRWSVFGEYRGSFSQNNLDLDSGGTLSTDIFSNSLTIGLTLGF
ncbi:MAG: outer membrane protein, partial [Paracoccaceae bacterium]